MHILQRIDKRRLSHTSIHQFDEPYIKFYAKTTKSPYVRYSMRPQSSLTMLRQIRGIKKESSYF
jgi:hypothetical protein